MKKWILQSILLLLLVIQEKTKAQQLPAENTLDSLFDAAYSKNDFRTIASIYKQSYFYKKNPTLLYKSASNYARLRDTLNTYTTLDTALLCGYTNTYLLDGDTAFSFLRHQKRWQDLRLKYQEKHDDKEAVFYWGLYYGCLVLLFLLNLFLFITNRETSYLYLSIMLFGDAQWEMTMNSSLKIYFIKIMPWMSSVMVKQVPSVLFLEILFIAYVLFSRAFLRLKERMPLANKIFSLIVLLIILILLPIYFNTKPIPELINTLVVWLSLLFCLITGLIIWRKGFPEGKFYGIASILFTFGIYFGVFFDRKPVLFVYSFLNIGLFLFFIILTAGVASKMRAMRREKEQAQEKALEVLEAKVQDRTKEVVQQKNEITFQKHLIEEKQKEIIESLTYAKRLQQAILPPEEFIKKFTRDSFVLYKPKDIVAGDFYWAENINNLFFIAVADSTGHGVPGAMVSVVCSNALNRSLKEFGLIETGKILDKTRELVIETFKKNNADVKDGMDISLLCIDKENHKIFWSGANNPIWYLEDTELREIKADKQPIGKSDNQKPFTTHTIEYKANRIFYLFTDGYADQFGGPKGKKFKYKQFFDLIQNKKDLPLAQQCENMNKIFNEWKGSLEQVDDVCIIGVKI